MANNHTVTITLTDNSDPNGPNHFNYAPGYLRVHVGDTVRFSCNRAFKVKFPYESPFDGTTEFSKDSAGNTSYATVATGTGLTAMVVGLEFTDSLVAVIVACPTPIAVTVAGEPLALTVSTVGLLDTQVMVRPLST